MSVWADMYVAGLSTSMIAKASGVPVSRVRTALIRQGVNLRSAADGMRAFLRDNPRPKGYKRQPFTAEHRARIAAARTLAGERTAKGVSLKPSGYLEHTRGPHKGRSVHVVIMEARLGRRLLPDEHVHHIDGDKTHNKDNNLALVTRSGHMRLHRRADFHLRKRDALGRIA